MDQKSPEQQDIVKTCEGHDANGGRKNPRSAPLVKAC